MSGDAPDDAPGTSVQRPLYVSLHGAGINLASGRKAPSGPLQVVWSLLRTVGLVLMFAGLWLVGSQAVRRVQVSAHTSAPTPTSSKQPCQGGREGGRAPAAHRHRVDVASSAFRAAERHQRVQCQASLHSARMCEPCQGHAGGRGGRRACSCGSAQEGFGVRRLGASVSVGPPLLDVAVGAGRHGWHARHRDYGLKRRKLSGALIGLIV